MNVVCRATASQTNAGCQESTRSRAPQPAAATFTGKPQLTHRASARSGVTLVSMIRTDGSTAPLTRPDGSPIRILAVDDESSLTELLSMAMRYEGWQVSTAASGGPAVKVARETRPDAIVLDMMASGLVSRATLTAWPPDAAVETCQPS